MPITAQQLLGILPNAGKRAGVFASALNLAMDRFQINTRLRMAAFIALVGQESGQFRYVRELGGDQYLSKYDTGTLAKRLGNTPDADGGGVKFRGRGLFDQRGQAINGFSKVHGFGVEIDFFDFGIGSHHGGGLLRESGAQHSGLAKHFECGVHGALTLLRLRRAMKAARTRATLRQATGSSSRGAYVRHCQ